MNKNGNFNNISDQVQFSVIIPVYNVGEDLRRCLDSFIDQPYDDYEIILIDDGSTDVSSAKICNEYVERYAYVSCVHKENGGCVSARRCGALCANGKYLIFGDGDDYVSKTFMENLHKAVTHEADYFVLNNCTNKLGTSDFYTEKQNLKTGYTDLDWLYKKILSVSMNAVWDKIYVKNLFLSILDIISENINFGEDSYINMKYLPLVKQVYVQDTADYYHFVDSPTSVCARDISTKRLYEVDVQYQTGDELFEKLNYISIKDTFMEYICGIYFRTTAKLIQQRIDKVELNEKMDELSVTNALMKWEPIYVKTRIYHWLLKHRAFDLIYILAKLRGNKWRY